MWEHWDSWTEDKGFMDPSMNSFNHFGMGSIGRWIYQYVAGIDTDDQIVGFKRIKIQPNPGNGVSFVKSSYKSINGFIENSWQTIGNQFTTIPVNTMASVDLTFAKSGKVHEVGSGTYTFKVTMD
ncbi:unnamed protein product [Oppiella nova]|uniref:alpha-L-rhamnosidase n=1 Tax=Oppiella nova TaxID=334625 RepID=A0A7R9MD81_9ACAR|nr:unnamed protein product [Oppiella nova]CAG2175148.1 unnamed protein product [Oppiella nova]